MVIDTSAFLAILQDEPDRRSFTEAIGAAAVRRTSAATFVEASMVLQSRYGAEGIQRLDMLLESARIEVMAVDPAQARMARRAFVDFGKGRHPAGLNYGDCFTYALASQLGEPLLCKGDDFRANGSRLGPATGADSVGAGSHPIDRFSRASPSRTSARVR